MIGRRIASISRPRQWLPAVLVSLLIVACSSTATQAPVQGSPGSTPAVGQSVGPVSSVGGPTATGGALEGAIGLAAGTSHLCVLTSDGGVTCLGANYKGQLGIGATSTDTTTTTHPLGLLTGVKAIVAANDYSCALTDAGGVKCWGTGAVGNGAAALTTAPTDVVGLTSGVSAISAGSDFACAVLSAGGVKCWGSNAVGQLGNGTKIDSSIPVDVTGLSSGVTAVGAGYNHSCALTSGGAVKCWGANPVGQLGNGSTTLSATPVDVVGLASGVSAIAVGHQSSCALASAGTVKCWGGQSGIPVDIAGLTGTSSIYTSLLGLTCAIAGDGGLKCWLDSKPTPADLPSLTNPVRAVAVGGQSTQCVLTTSGAVSCFDPRATAWTDVSLTLTGGGPTPSSAVTGNTTAIAMGALHTCALTSAGGVKCWGYNSSGQVGNGSTAQAASPVDVVGLTSGVTAIAAGTYYSCALASGGVKCWGGNDEGVLGNGGNANSLIPVDVVGLTSGVTAIAGSDRHACAVASGGGVKCWGANGYGELGNGSTTGSNTPVDVKGLTSGVTALAASKDATCGITSGGGVKCWGYDVLGQLGDGGRAVQQSVPVDVAGLSSGVTAIAMGEEYSCALMTGGTVKCWGISQGGALGNGTATQNKAPVDVVGLAGPISAIATGRDYTCALSGAGGVTCWGQNGVGQLGNGTKANSNVPVDVAGLSTGIRAIVAGTKFACAITIGGAVKCWGDGFGTTPIDVAGL